MYVTDTHAFVYFALNRPSRLGRRAARLFKEADAGKMLIYVPSIVLWEVVSIVRRKVLHLPGEFDHWCRDLQASAGFAIEPLDWVDIDEARKLPFSDPYDCLIGGTAIRMAMPLITRDSVIVDSGLVETVW